MFKFTTDAIPKARIPVRISNFFIELIRLSNESNLSKEKTVNLSQHKIPENEVYSLVE